MKKNHIIWNMVAFAKRHPLLRYPTLGLLAAYLFVRNLFTRLHQRLSSAPQKKKYLATGLTLVAVCVVLVGIGISVRALENGNDSTEAALLAEGTQASETEMPTESEPTESEDSESENQDSESESQDSESEDSETEDSETEDTETEDSEIQDTEDGGFELADELEPIEEENVKGSGTQADPYLISSITSSTITTGGYYLFDASPTTSFDFLLSSSATNLHLVFKNDITLTYSIEIDGASVPVYIESQSGSSPTIYTNSYVRFLLTGVTNAYINDLTFDCGDMNNAILYSNHSNVTVSNCIFQRGACIHNCYNGSNAVLTLENGCVFRNTTNGSFLIFNHVGSTSGISATLNINGLTIQNCTCNTPDGIIDNGNEGNDASQLTMNVTDLKITGCSNSKGPMIYASKCISNLSGTISITNNTVGSVGAVSLAESYTMNLGGNITIKDNLYSGNQLNLRFLNTGLININSSLTGTIGVTMRDSTTSTATSGTFTSGYSTYGKDYDNHPLDPSRVFFSDQSSYYVAFDSSHEAMLTDHNYTWSGCLTENGNTAYVYCTETGCSHYGTEDSHSGAANYSLFAQDKDYDGKAYRPVDYISTSNNLDGFGYHVGDIYYEGTGTTRYAKTTTPPTDAGTYRACQDVEVISGDYLTLTVYDDFTIIGGLLYVTDPVEKELTFNHNSQELLTPGTISKEEPTGASSGAVLPLQETGYGLFHYRLGEDGEWTDDIPAATHVGTYRIYYYVESSTTGYLDIGSEDDPMGYVETIIEPKELTLDMLTIEQAEFDYSGQEIVPVFSLKDGDYDMVQGVDYTVSGDLSAKEAGDYTIFFSASEDSDYIGDLETAWAIYEPEYDSEDDEIDDSEDTEEPSVSEPSSTPKFGTRIRKTGDSPVRSFVALMILLFGAALVLCGILIGRSVRRANQPPEKKMPWD